MKNFKKSLIPILMGVVLIIAGCASLTGSQKGAAVGTVTGAAMGAVIGKTANNTALGTIIGAAVGGTAGALIGNQMDKQAEEIRKNVPDAEVVRVGEGIVVEFSSKVLFGFDQSNLTTESRNSLDKLVAVLEEYPDTNIEVQGHTDSKGSDAYNQTLSEKRAYTVSSYLKEKGISINRLTINGFGEKLPKYFNDTEDGRDQNRRVEFLITANDKMKADAKSNSSN